MYLTNFFTKKFTVVAANDIITNYRLNETIGSCRPRRFRFWSFVKLSYLRRFTDSLQEIFAQITFNVAFYYFKIISFHCLIQTKSKPCKMSYILQDLFLVINLQYLKYDPLHVTFGMAILHNSFVNYVSNVWHKMTVIPVSKASEGEPNVIGTISWLNMIKRQVDCCIILCCWIWCSFFTCITFQ